MIFNLDKHARQLLFDDTKAKTGSKNVQGAIEAVKTEVDSVKSEVNGVGKIIYPVSTNNGTMSVTHTLPSGVSEPVHEIELQKGNYLIYVGVRWGYNAKGFRTIGISTATEREYSLTTYDNTDTRLPIVNTNMFHTAVFPYVATRDETYLYLLAYQNSESNLALNVEVMKAIKLNDEAITEYF